MANLTSVICTIVLRTLYKRENEKRDRAKAEATRTGFGMDVFEDYIVIGGASEESTTARKVERRFLDVTDNKNKAFRYVL